MAVAVEAGRVGLKRAVVVGLTLTASLGATFLMMKGFEYREDIHKHLVPSTPDFSLSEMGSQVFPRSTGS